MNSILLLVLSVLVATSVAVLPGETRTPVEILGASVGNPIKAIYVDWHLNWNDPGQSVLDAVNAGYNVIIISFYLSGGTAADMAQAWAALADSEKQSVISQAHSKGAVVTVSLGGSTDSPYDKDATALGAAVANWAKTQYLDGVDFDLENINQGFTAGSMSASQLVTWMADLSVSASNTFGSGAIISHAPQAPYFGNIGGSGWAGSTGGYTGVMAQADKAITFLNVQFYNQGASCYVDYNGLFISSSGCAPFPGTSVKEIGVSGVNVNKIVVGKPVTTADASNGWISGSDFAGYVKQAGSDLGWNAGIMGWVWNDAATCAAWVQAIYPGGGNSGGVSATISNSAATSGTGNSATSGTGTSATSATSATAATSGTSGAGCSGKAAGMYCTDSTHFEWCPQGIVQSCGAGTTCVQQGTSIECA